MKILPTPRMNMSQTEPHKGSGETSSVPASSFHKDSDHSERWLFFTMLAGLLGLLATTLWLSLPEQKENITELSQHIDADNNKILLNEPITPIPDDVMLDPYKVTLGQRLFFDARLSADNTIACVTCHDLSKGGADSIAHSRGIGGAEGDINTLSVFNSAYNFTLFWDGRAKTLEEQIDGPIHNIKEMATNWPTIIAKLMKDKDFVADFSRVYTGELSSENIKDAIVHFERSLITPNSRFDRYLRGDANAINNDELKGYHLFKDYGCIACHQGMNVGGNLFQAFGIIDDYFTDRGGLSQADLGRFNVTGRDEDRHRFRVPSLRNVALTAPYFHDGSTATLKQAVMVMAKYQLGRKIPEQDIDLIIQFLKTLTGEYKGNPL